MNQKLLLYRSVKENVYIENSGIFLPRILKRLQKIWIERLILVYYNSAIYKIYTYIDTKSIFY